MIPAVKEESALKLVRRSRSRNFINEEMPYLMRKKKFGGLPISKLLINI